MSSSSLGVCFNPDCREKKLDRSNKGWSLQSGEYAELCNHCSFAFEQGRFCETFHLSASGWRHCESCKKSIHCGCIVSAQKYVLLDAGGIGCILCAKKSLILTPNRWPASLFNAASLPERAKDFSVKNWGQSQTGGSAPVGPFRRPPHLASAASHPELHPRVPYGLDISSGLARLVVSEHSSISSQEKKTIDDPSERLMNGSLKLGISNLHDNNNVTNFVEQSTSHSKNVPLLLPTKDELSTPNFPLAVPSDLPNGTNCQAKRSGTHSQRPSPSPPLAKQFHVSSHIGLEVCNENHTRNGRPRGDARGRNYLLSRYLPKMTDEELQKISGDSNAVITPLFEKTLSASDAGRIGRLVLPKKCAEAYFPQISQPEGLPIKVQDLEGQEWQFQFRFWPNNNSRMYVLEGVTPCIQSMKLQAGDTVTFSRLGQEGKLVMGCRKASVPSIDRGNQIVEVGNGSSTPGDVNSTDPASNLSQVDGLGYNAKEMLGNKSSLPRKRKSSTLGSKSKRLRIDNEEMMELKLTWEEAQGLIRPPCNHVPSVVVIEGYEFEEYEDAPILGRPTIFAGSHVGDGEQWAQCEDCLKWRRIPVDALLPARWTCSENLWDMERSTCSTAQELSTEQLEDMLSTIVLDDSKRIKAGKEEPDAYEALEGLDTLANLAILGEGEGLPPSSQATTKHPRHRPGCSCIVCIQPPSGKGQKHKQNCVCTVCLTVKRRFRTLMMRREKKLSEKDPDQLSCKKQQDDLPLPDKVLDDDSLPCSAGNSSSDQRLLTGNEGSEEEPGRIVASASPFKGQIDLNIQPEREDEMSPGSESSSMARLLQAPPLQKCLESNGGDESSMPGQAHAGGSEKLGSGVAPAGGSDHEGEVVDRVN